MLSSQQAILLYEKCLADEISDEDGIVLLRYLEANEGFTKDVYDNLYLDFLLKRRNNGASDNRDTMREPQHHSQQCDDLLAWLDQLEQLAESTPASTTYRPATKQDQSRFSETLRSVFAPRRGSGKRSRLRLRNIVVGLFCVAFLFWMLVPRPVAKPKTEALGRIVSVIDPVWPEDGVVFKENQKLDNEAIRLKSGMVELLLENGVSMIAQGPGEFQVDSLLSSFCKEGRLSIHVPPEGSGFLLETPRLTLRDIGTDFLVNVTPEHSELHVIKGAVEANWMNGEWRTYHEGRGVFVDQGNTPKQIVSDKKQFISREAMEQIVAKHREERKSTWEQFSSQEDDDPTLQARFDFNVQRPGSCPNLAGSRRASDLRISRMKTTPGRWEGRTALLADSSSGAAMVDVPGKSDSLTMIALLKLNRLDRACQGIFMSRSFGRGKILWYFNRRGAVQLMVQPDRDRTPVKYESEPFFSERNWETWFHLAVVVDAKNKTVSHYYDGRIVGVLPIVNPIPLDIGQADLGNWISDNKSVADRFLDGAVDEFMLYGRALSPEEIHEHFESSK